MQFRIIILILGLFPFSLFADETPVLARTGKTFNASIPTIKSVLGHDFGEAITRHKDMERYLEALASSAPERMKYVPIGKTFEGRTLYYVIISSAENMSRFEDFRKANLQLSDPRNLPPSQAQSIIENHPVFVGLSYSVHGNEHSGVEAGLAMMYYLLSADDEETKNILKNTIVIIDPMQNPDGRERFINYFYSTSGKNPNLDLNSAEHNEGWPSGRTNHYLFDMNRDWTVLSQAESRARVLAYRQYQPQIYIDVHEMGSNTSYFFPPPTVPQNPNIPKSLPGWWNTLGKAIAADFDKHGIDYFTQEGFDFWYPGYGDSWTTYNGALTGTFEQASVRGLAVKREDGIVLHYQDAIWHHFLSSLATCKMASINRKEKLKDFYNYRLTAVQEGKAGPIKEFIIRRSNDPAQADRAVQNLLMHGIEVKQASADFRIDVNGYYSDRSEPQNFLAGDYIIPMDQPLKRLIQVMIEKESQFEKKFLEEEAKRREADEPSELYDITAWSMPLAMGLDAYWSGTVTPVSKTDVLEIRKQNHPVAASNYAYVLNYKSNEDIATVLELLNHGIRVYFSAKPFTLAGASYNAGSFIIKVKGNIEDLTETLSEIAQQTGAEFIPAKTGWTEQGPDFGSGNVSLLRKPRVAVLMNIPTDSYSYGEINYLLDQRFYLQFTPIQAFYFNSINLKDYDVIVLPDSSGIMGGYKGVLGSKGITKLKNWIESGGTLIAIQGAAAFIADDGELTDVKRIKKFVKDSIEEAEEKEEKEEDDEPAKEDQKTESPDYVIGSIARVELNLKEFLTFGYSRAEAPVFVNSSNVFSVPHDFRPAASYAAFDRFKMAGLFWDLTKKRLEKKAYATRESLGQGHVILFAENPNFRAAWESLNKLFMNGILFGPSM